MVWRAALTLAPTGTTHTHTPTHLEIISLNDRNRHVVRRRAYVLVFLLVEYIDSNQMNLKATFD